MPEHLSEISSLLLTCPLRMSALLAEEITALGFPVEKISDTGVFIKGSISQGMALNLHSRLASRVLYLVKEFWARSPQDLYRSLFSVAWEDLLPADGYFSVVSSVDNPSINNTQYAQQKCKDAIVDRIRQKMGRRPDSGSDISKAVVFLYWHGTSCSVYIDLSGEPLHRRGYRLQPWRAPMRESLAAAVLCSMNWPPYSAPLVNPMCGSGTLAIEAAMMSAGMAPALKRRNFGFMHVLGFDKQLWQHLLFEAAAAVKTAPPSPFIYASDIEKAAVNIARKNASNAGLEDWISFEVSDFAASTLPDMPGAIVMNPEYGDRLGQEKYLEEEYKRIGDFFKQKCQGYWGYIFTGNMQAAKNIGLRTKRRIEFFNADIDCRLLEFELYRGSREISAIRPEQ
jgi:putative N6-adenine-specific DNA methylase